MLTVLYLTEDDMLEHMKNKKVGYNSFPAKRSDEQFSRKIEDADIVIFKRHGLYLMKNRFAPKQYHIPNKILKPLDLSKLSWVERSNEEPQLYICKVCSGWFAEEDTNTVYNICLPCVCLPCVKTILNKAIEGEKK